MAKYINKQMAIDAINGDLDVWTWNDLAADWHDVSINLLTKQDYAADRHFAIGEKPTSPPRKMIEIDGVVMPAPIMREEELPETVGILFSDGCVCTLKRDTFSARARAAKNGNVFATEADAIAARDARKLILELAMERAK